jgi:hypothetical protein
MARFVTCRRALCGVVLGIVLAAVFAACGDSGGDASAAAPVDPPGPVDAQVGGTVDRGGANITLTEVGATHSFGNFDNAEPGYLFISAYFVVTNSGSGSIELGPEAMILELPGGEVGIARQAAPAARLANAGPAPGGEERGWRSWEVPEGTLAVTVSYKPTTDTEIRFGIIVPTDIRERWRV